MRILTTLAILAFVVACVRFQPGQGVTADFAARYGCDALEVEERAKALKAQLGRGKVYIPQVGWDACNLLAHNGRPTKIDRQQLGNRRSMSWWYQSDYDAHLVTLRWTPDRAAWIVTYVGW